jgi:hypothetical protein
MLLYLMQVLRICCIRHRPDARFALHSAAKEAAGAPSDRKDPITELVARKIIEIAETGEHDPDRLGARALEELGVSLPSTATQKGSPSPSS